MVRPPLSLNYVSQLRFPQGDLQSSGAAANDNGRPQERDRPLRGWVTDITHGIAREHESADNRRL